MTGSPPRSTFLPTPARKTSPPVTTTMSIRRQRILDILLRERRPLTLIEAAAGSGKTVMAAQWAGELGDPVAWVTLDATDNDPVVLISSVMDAVCHGDPEPVWGPHPLTGDEPTYSRNVLPNYRIALESLPGPVTLVFDDAHEVTEARAAAVLRATVDSLPAGSHSIMVGRTLASLPVASWLSSDQTALLTDAELAMNAREVAEVVSHLGDTPLSSEALAQLLTATQGWAIAVYLGARLGSPAKLATAGYVNSYLDQEVLRGADAATIRLLRETAPLLDLSADLCDAVLQTHGSGSILDRAEQHSLLITRSEDHHWFRLHPLLRERLLALLRAENPALCRTVARRASEWTMARGLTDRAIGYARESGDMDLLGTTIWEGATQALTTGQTQRVADWLDALDDNTIAGSCPLAMTAAWCAISQGRPADAYRWSQAAFGTAHEDWQANLHRSTLEAGLALLLSTSGTLSYERSAVLAGQAMRSLPVDHPALPYAQVMTGWMQVLGGARDIGLTNLTQAAQLARSRGLLGTEVEASGLLATALLSRGDYSGAESLVATALRTWSQGGISHFLAAGAVIAGPAALVAARTGQAELARSQLARVREAVTMFGPFLPWLAVTHECFAAAAHALLGDKEQAGRHLASAVESAAAAPESTVLNDLLRAARTTVEGESRLAALSPAERRVFERLLTRATLREIAEELFVSPETVKTQTSSIYRKMGAASRRELQELGDRLRASPGSGP